MMLLHRQRSGNAGFTLAEMLFTLAIGSFVMVGVMTSYIFCTRGCRGLSNYGEIQQDGRRSLEWFARDLRSGLGVSDCTSNRLVVLLPAAVNANAKVTATNQVTHLGNGDGWYRSDSVDGRTTRLAENVNQLTFSLFDAAGNSTTQVTAAVSVQVRAVLQKRTGNKVQSTDFLSARLRMRNCQ